MSEVVQLGSPDVKALCELLRVCWLDTYTGLLPEPIIRTAMQVWHSEENIQRGIKNPEAYYGGFKEGESLLGMVAGRMLSKDTLRISQLYVHPEHQRKGIGRKLMDAALKHFDQAKTVVLEVEEGNSKGINFYGSYGFGFPRKTIVKLEGYEIPSLVGELHLSRT